MPAFEANFYAAWHNKIQASLRLLDQPATSPPERLLQGVWNHQRIQRETLKTIDGQTVRVLHPGFWNREAGPDFQGAFIQIGDDPPRSGDIEVDLTPACWHTHGHDANPAFQNVILHVIWNNPGDQPSTSIPTLTLESYLDSPLDQIEFWFQSEAAQSWPAGLSGNCCAPMSHLPPEEAIDLLHQAAQIRFHTKARALEARARQCGWEQTLWEGLFRALGYKHNVWPMQRLAELLPQICEPPATLLDLQARLLGAGNLLPTDTTAAAPAPYLRELWDHWWRQRDRYPLLPQKLWRFGGLRPANQPQRRLALAAHWLAQGDLVARIETWFTADISDKTLAPTLLKNLQPPIDPFWSSHWNLNSPRLSKLQPLLGASRLTDLAVNVILPWFWTRAQCGRNEKLQAVAEHRFYQWPAAQDNAVLRLARQRLFGQTNLPWLKTAAAQQGLLQIVRDCCNHSNAICADCPFPDLVRSWDVFKHLKNS